MSDQWLFKSETYDNCNCAVNCGCQFNLPSTHVFCQSAFVGKVVEGISMILRLSGCIGQGYTSGRAKSPTGMANVKPSLTRPQPGISVARWRPSFQGRRASH
jgi:hypothetical protein